MRRPLFKAGLSLLLGGVAVTAAFGAWLWAYRAGRVDLPDIGRDGVIFIITDNVRADRTSLCGYDVPLTPTLSSLATEAGAVSTCRAYAPGSWTLPSHASYFTGVEVLQHGAHEYAGSVDNPDGTAVVAHGLDSTLPTLAETMRSRGYQTVLLAGNPVVGKGMGLSRGYDFAKSARRFGDFNHDELTRDLRTVLRKNLDPLGGPVFLTVNLAEAHRPWRAVPRDHAFIHRRPSLQFDNQSSDADWVTYLNGTMERREKRRFISHISDVYDYGVERADDGVRAVLRVVRDEGWCRDRCRIVITSDHGEFIGEHGLIDHGFYSWEPNAQVFLLALGTEVTAFPEPISALVAYSLVLDGKLPDPLPPVQQAAWPHVRRSLHTGGHAYSSTSVARWVGWTKHLWMDGTLKSFDLQADPGEISPIDLHPPVDFVALIERVKAATHVASAGDADVLEALKAAGYVE